FLQAYASQRMLVSEPQLLFNDGIQINAINPGDVGSEALSLLCGMETIMDAPARGIIKLLHESTLKAGVQISDSDSGSVLLNLNRSFESHPAYSTGSSFSSTFG